VGSFVAILGLAPMHAPATAFGAIGSGAVAAIGDPQAASDLLDKVIRVRAGAAGKGPAMASGQRHTGTALRLGI
jgi:hypothetical protein